jgi:hypothetical protein
MDKIKELIAKQRGHNKAKGNKHIKAEIVAFQYIFKTASRHKHVRLNIPETLIYGSEIGFDQPSTIYTTEQGYLKC